MSNHEGKTLTLWYSEDMVRAVALVNEGMATQKLPESAMYRDQLLLAEFLNIAIPHIYNTST